MPKLTYVGQPLRAVPHEEITEGIRIKYNVNGKVVKIIKVRFWETRPNGDWIGELTYKGTRGLMVDIKHDQLEDFTFLGKRKSILQRIHDFMALQIEIARGERVSR